MSTGRASSSVTESDVDTHNFTGKRPLDPGDDDKVCGLDLCDELDECSVCVNDCEGDQMSRMRTARRSLVDGETSTNSTSERVEVRSRMVAWEIKQNGDWQLLRRNSTVSARSKGM